MIPDETKAQDPVGAIYRFNARIIDATQELVCAYKPNMAFYEAYHRLEALEWTIQHIHRFYPDIPIILDGKRGDIGNTSAAYAETAFEWLQADAVTVNPYLGEEALEPFLHYEDKGIFVLCMTSNSGAGEFQKIRIGSGGVGGIPFYQIVANHVAGQWNRRGNCGLVVGATQPEELAAVRALVGDLPILIPGIGAQGGDVQKIVHAGQDSNGQGMIINSSRGIIFDPHPGDAAKKLSDSINQSRKETSC